MSKAVLLTASFGDGHHKVAEALAERFLGHGVQPVVIDCYRSNRPKMADLGERVYDWTTRHTPVLYGASYHLTSDMGPDHRLWRILSSFSKKRLLEQLQEENPDVILQLFPDHVLADLDRSSGSPLIGTVLTDFSVHGRWFHRNVDVYFFPHEQLVRAAKPFLQQADAVAAGIPIRAQFQEDRPGTQIPTHPYILVATGGRGVFPDLGDVVQALRRYWPNHAVYVLCGRNEQMKAAVNGMGPQVFGLPLIQEMASWLRDAEFAVMKSGGITVAECLATETPMLIFKPQPGQESDNARFVMRMGAAYIARDLASFELVAVQMGTGNALARMKSACRSIGRANAAERIVDECLRRMAESHLVM